jgi:hypothetical protein
VWVGRGLIRTRTTHKPAIEPTKGWGTGYPDLYHGPSYSPVSYFFSLLFELLG